MTFDEFLSKFQVKTNFLKNYGLCHAIPQKWINQLNGKRKLITNPSNNNNKNLLLDKLSCKSGASQMFVKLKFETPTAEKRMKQANFDAETIRTTYTIPFKVSKDTTLAIFSLRSSITFYPLTLLFSGTRSFNKRIVTRVTRNKP